MNAGKRVLIVDDNIDAAVALGNALSLFGHQVRVSYDGKSAMQEMKDFRPDVAILDIKMPDMDGYELARQAREQPGFRNLRLVALTGAVDEVDRLAKPESGFQAYLLKPVDLRMAVELLQKLWLAPAPAAAPMKAARA
jgi:CheY-like chemotaxis protein